MIWFTADWHLQHKNIIKFNGRPFQSVEEMDNVIIDNFLSSVIKGDHVYFLGDFSFNRTKTREVLEYIKIKKHIQWHFILGNHDSKVANILKDLSADSITNMRDIKIQDIPITLCHYKMTVWNKSHFNAWQLYGHSHGSLYPTGKQLDVGVDTNNFYPYSFEEVKKIMDASPDNFNLVKERKY